MESNKHNDELIKRKLADLNAEPRKLNFATVHANYEKAKQASSKKWGIYFIFSGLAIAVLVTTYVLLMPNVDSPVAQNEAPVSAQPINDANKITSVGTSTEDKFAERYNSDNIVNSGKETTEENKTNTIANNSSSSSETAMNSEKTNTKEENITTRNKETSKKENTTAITNKNTTAAKNNNVTGKKEQTTIASKVEKIKTSNDTNNDSKNEELASNTKSNDNVPITRSGNARSGVGQKKQGKKQTTNGTTIDDQLKKNALANNSDQDQSSNASGESDAADNNAGANSKGNDTADQNSESKDQNNNNTVVDTKSQNETAKTDSVSNKNETAAKVDTAHAEGHIPGVIGTGSVSPRNKHKWLVGAEVSYNSISYNAKENPNSPSQFSTGDPAFSTAYANAVGKGKHSLLTGALSFGYVYNEKIGVSAGLSYFNVKHKFTVGSSSTPQYSTAVDYYVWSYVQDNTVSPPTLTLKIVDTVYKQVPTGKNITAGTTVNGDSISTATFENNLRYVNIPLNISYNFKIGAKFSIEPQAGIIYAMPLRSQHLVASNAYTFEYNKQKTDLKKNLYFNTALKFGYNISNKMQVYVRGGYFFRNQSVYNAAQPITMSLKSIYTSFGMTFRIK
jgi:hypothetical protein